MCNLSKQKADACLENVRCKPLVVINAGIRQTGMKEIKLYKSKWKNLGLLIVSCLFVFGGLYFVTDVDSNTFKVIVGWTSILFFGLGIPIALFNILDWRPQIIINEVGIYDRTIIKDLINWSIIENAYL